MESRRRPSNSATGVIESVETTDAGGVTVPTGRGRIKFLDGDTPSQLVLLPEGREEPKMGTMVQLTRTDAGWVCTAYVKKPSRGGGRAPSSSPTGQGDASLKGYEVKGQSIEESSQTLVSEVSARKTGDVLARNIKTGAFLRFDTYGPESADESEIAVRLGIPNATVEIDKKGNVFLSAAKAIWSGARNFYFETLNTFKVVTNIYRLLAGEVVVVADTRYSLESPDVSIASGKIHLGAAADKYPVLLAKPGVGEESAAVYIPVFEVKVVVPGVGICSGWNGPLRGYGSLAKSKHLKVS